MTDCRNPNDGLWAQRGTLFFPVSAVTKELPAGAYRHQTCGDVFLEQVPIDTDKLLALPDAALERLLAESKKFWTQGVGEQYAKRGFIHKRGLFMIGPPGTGKTCAIRQMESELIRNHNGLVVIIDDPEPASACLRELRRIEPERPVMIVMEDLNELVEEHGAPGFLALLDGDAQIPNVLFVATANDLDGLDERFLHRPSRFDTIIEVGTLSAKARRAYLKATEPSLDEATLERLVNRSEGYTIAHLRELIIAINVLDQDEHSVFERLDSMR